LAITWLTSFEQLGEAARSLLRRLAWLSPAPIPESLLEVPIAGEAANPGGAFDALVELEGLSLLNRSSESPQFVVHRLVQEVTRLRQELAQEPHELAAALAWIDAAFVGDPQDVRSWSVLEPLESHAKAVASFAAGAGVAGVTARLLNQVATLLLTKAAYYEAEPMYRLALGIEENIYGQDHPNVAMCLNNLAALLQATNRLAEAEPLKRRALRIDESSYGQDHPIVAVRLNNLAQLLQDTNRLADAELLMRRALQIDEASYGQDHPNVARHLNNLAALLQATNQLSEAEPLLRRALRIDEASYGQDHPIVAIRLSNLAALLQDTHQLSEAELMYRRALQIDEASYGQDHPSVARDLNNLAQLLRATNKLSKAEVVYRRCLQILIVSMQQQGYQHPNLQTVINNYIILLQVQGFSEEAIQAKIGSLYQQD
jgi:tetratricopeptide (TPR) repeat protein